MQEDAIKRHIIEDPHRVLSDKTVLNALVGAESRFRDRNIVDLRGVQVERLEESLDQLSSTHRDVIAAAYDNLSGTNQIHRAALALIEADSFDGFLTAIAEDLPRILNADGLHVCLEGPAALPGQLLGPEGPLRHTIIGMPVGGVAAYFGGSRAVQRGRVLLRPVTRTANLVYGAQAPSMRSEAIIQLDLGDGRLAGMLAIGSFDLSRFHPDKGTDLLEFLGRVTDSCLRRWLQ